MQKFILIIILFLLSSYQIKNETDLPKGYWKIIFFSERGYLTSSHGKSLDETIEYKDSNVVLIPNITCGFYFDDFIAMDYCNIDKKERQNIGLLMILKQTFIFILNLNKMEIQLTIWSLLAKKLFLNFQKTP